jgi:hypothetical protein
MRLEADQPMNVVSRGMLHEASSMLFDATREIRRNADV